MINEKDRLGFISVQVVPMYTQSKIANQRKILIYKSVFEKNDFAPNQIMISIKNSKKFKFYDHQ